MYRRCIFCSADLGTNHALEPFPVGRSVAFDGWRGRLWAVCPRCARWNLAPVEERWEAVEAAERLFAGTRRRVHAENVGLAVLPDGTRLVRVGEALPGELAAWRYGRELRKRRRSYWLETAVSLLDPTLLLLRQHAVGSRIVCQVTVRDARTDRLALPVWRLDGARIRAGAAGELDIDLPEVRTLLHSAPPLRTVGGRSVLERAIASANESGASRRSLGAALAHLEAAGSAEEYVSRLVGGAEPGALLLRRNALGGFRGFWLPAGSAEPRPVSTPEVLALEMALHDEAERRAMAGVLHELVARWREAEEIAAIADALPDDPLRRLAPGDGST
ncbi:MAG TPA: hypothetical protein VFX98_13510 [Longimicrobiaceae bacterium]|nr:hypothetical protein [Longimicrobiaceae bacterium]